jgi:hypothetical protein
VLVCVKILGTENLYFSVQMLDLNRYPVYLNCYLVLNVDDN